MVPRELQVIKELLVIKERKARRDKTVLKVKKEIVGLRR
jgi:hypothetical protein